MGMPALKLQFEEVSVEERLARLETSVENIHSNVAEMKVDIRRLNDKIDGVDQRLSAKIDGVEGKLCAKIDGVEEKLCAKIEAVDQRVYSVERNLSAKIDGVKDAIAALTLSSEKMISKRTLWAMTLYIGLVVTLLTVIAHSVHWP
jgi:hypothetical protein